MVHCEAQYTQKIFWEKHVSWSTMFGKYSQLYPQLKIYKVRYNIEGSKKSCNKGLCHYFIYFPDVWDSGPFFLLT